MYESCKVRRKGRHFYRCLYLASFSWRRRPSRSASACRTVRCRRASKRVRSAREDAELEGWRVWEGAIGPWVSLAMAVCRGFDCRVASCRLAAILYD